MNAGALHRYDADVSFIWIENGALHLIRDSDGTPSFVWLKGKEWLIQQTYHHFCKDNRSSDSVPIQLAEYLIGANRCENLDTAVQTVVIELDALVRSASNALVSSTKVERSEPEFITVDGPSYAVNLRLDGGTAQIRMYENELKKSVQTIFRAVKDCEGELDVNRIVASDF